jgi:type IV pilus assembly protein PilY1
VVIDDVGPVASAPTRLQNNLQKELWLFFGTGRYFYEDAVGADDAAGTRHLVGIREPCYDTVSPGNPLPVTCNTAVNPADLADVTAIAAGVNDPEGWYITLDPQEPAFKPYKDVCSIGGKSHIWAVYYASGGAAGDLLRGTALIQVSTGSIEKIDLGSAFSDKGGRRTSAIEGVPPIAQGFSIFKTPPPVERIIHMQEK